MGLCDEEVPIFIDTNLETHIAMAVSPEITIGDLKRKFVKEHSMCFPEIGKIGINGVMVKRKSFFYYLPDSMPVNNAFQRLKGRVWFLRINVTPVVCSVKHFPSGGLVDEPKDSAFCSSNVTDCQNPEDSMNLPSMNDKNDNHKRRAREISPTLEDAMKELLLPVNVSMRKKRKTCSNSHEKVQDGVNREEALLDTSKEVHGVSSQGRLLQYNALKSNDRKQDSSSSQPIGNASSPDLSHNVSVSGILTRFFPDFDEVKSYAGSSSDRIIDFLEKETYRADQGVTLKTNAATGAARAKLGKSKTRKPMSSKTALPDSPKPKTVKGCKLERSKVRNHLPPKVPSTVKPSPSTLIHRFETSGEVGKRLVQAANDLGIPTSKRKPAVLSFKSKGEKFSPTLVRKLDFDFE